MDINHCKILLTKYNQKHLLCQIDHDKIDRIHLSSFESSMPVGTIFIAKVLKILPGINAAFVSAGKEEQFFMNLPSKTDTDVMLTNRPYNGVLKCDDEIVVQLTKQAVKLKQAVVDWHIALQSRYAIVETGKTGFRISSKLSKSEKESLAVLKEISLSDVETIIRTNAASVSSDLVREDLTNLNNELTAIRNIYKSRICYSILKEAVPEYLSIIRDIPSETYDEIVTDDPIVYEKLQALFTGTMIQQQVRLYTDTYPLIKLYSLETRIGELLSNKVWLKNGGFLVIEQTETLTAVDVNTGKNDKKTNLIYATNLEAAEEICRQLRARNISGMILIDFINMKDASMNNALIEAMKESLRKDYVKANFIDITGLGLMELTREKKYASLKEMIKDSK